MKKIYFIVTLFLSLGAFSQQTIVKKPSPPLTNATKFDQATNRYIVYAYATDSMLVRKTSFSDKELTRQNGPEEIYHRNGQIAMSLNYLDGRRSGDYKTFSDKGTLVRHEKYINDERTEGKCYDENGNEIPYFELETRPEYPGGNKALYEYIGKNFNVGRNKEFGKIIVSFVIEKDGSVVDAKIIKGIGAALDQEAIRLVQNMEKWKPGQQNGKKVRVQYSLPINVPKP